MGSLFSLFVQTDKPNISERIKAQPPVKAATLKSQQQVSKQMIAKPSEKPVDNNNETNMELSNNPLQEALHFKPLPSTPPPTVQAVESKQKPDEAQMNPLAMKGISLKDYENQRRMVEEQNKQKKEILYRAIEQQ